MVKITSFRPYIPRNPQEFCIKPYDVIEADEEKELKKEPNCLVHMSLPDGEGDAKYQNAAIVFENFKTQQLIRRLDTPGIFVYRQESPTFSHQGFIFAVALQDYEDNQIVKHEHTREKPLADRTKHVTATSAMPGLVWTVYRTHKRINEIMETIKSQPELFSFDKYGYRNILWHCTDSGIISELTNLFATQKLYIADGHHRAASCAQYRKNKIQELQKAGEKVNPAAPWQYLMTYVASDDQIRIFPYNRVIRKLPMSVEEFLQKVELHFTISSQPKAFNPSRKNEIAMCLAGKWYQLIAKNTVFPELVDGLDVSIIQKDILEPILGIKDIRSNENIFFVGGIEDPKEMESFVTEDGNAIFFNVYPVDIRDLEAIADKGGVMPPKSTWFDPKLLSGLVTYSLIE
jgi:uncharacterized protein (DUF1015 family)